MKKLYVLVLITVTFSSCFQNFFKVQTSNVWSKNHIDSIKCSKKTVIVHFRNDIKTILTPTFDSNQITGKLGEYRKLYARENKPSYPKEINAYKKRDTCSIFGQVHVYVTEDYLGQNSITIDKDNFVCTNMYAHDPEATTINYIISIGILVALVVAAIAVSILAVLTKWNLVYLSFSP